MRADPTSIRPSDQIGLLDTSVIIGLDEIDPAALPAELSISTVTLAELSAGVHLVTGDDPLSAAERAVRLDRLQWVEASFVPLGFGADVARAFGRIVAAVRAAGRSHRSRTADLMIAATALANGLPLYTLNAADFSGLESLLPIVDARLVRG